MKIKKKKDFIFVCPLHFYRLLPFANVICIQDILKSITAGNFKLSQLIEDN